MVKLCRFLVGPISAISGGWYLSMGSCVYYGVVLYTLSVVEVARSAAEHHFTW